MSAVKHLPQRPLGEDDVGTLAGDDRFEVAPYGGVRTEAGFEIYALKLAAGERAYALGFDGETETWRQIAAVETTALAEADEQLDPMLDQWVLEQYGDRFEVLKPAESA